MNPPAWLPQLMSLHDYDGDWERYLEALYECFTKDFLDQALPNFQGLPMRLKRHPLEQGKEATFWHLISSGQNEQERIPDLRRCERLCWIRPIITEVTSQENSTPLIKVWKNRRKGETRICLWLSSHDYLVVLAQRHKYLLPWTAYTIIENHRKRKLQKEYESYWEDLKS